MAYHHIIILSLMFFIACGSVEYMIGDVSHESCNHVCKQHNKICDAAIVSSFSCADAARRICNNPYVHEDVDGGRGSCSEGGGCFINCAQWHYASIARWNGTCGYNWCSVGSDDSLRIVCPCSVYEERENDGVIFNVATTPAQYTGMSILVATTSVILMWLLYCCCSLQVLTRSVLLYFLYIPT